MKDQPMAVQLAAMFQEMESLRCEQTTLQQQQITLNQMHMTRQQDKKKAHDNIGTHMLSYSEDGSGDDQDDEAHVSKRRGDPCFHYTVLDQAWRATNTTTKYKSCDRNIQWKGQFNCPSYFFM